MSTIEETVAARGKHYGDFSKHARVAQGLKDLVKREWNARGVQIPDEVAEGMDMILHKIARIATGDPLYRDSWHDIQGYAKIVEDRLLPDTEEPPDGATR